MMYTSLLVAALYAGLAQAGIKLPPVPKDKSMPVQQRVSFNGPNAVSVAWNTYRKLEKPCVQYGTARNRLSQTTCSTTSVTYPSSRTWSNLVVLTGLSPGTTYYYRIKSTNNPITDSFKTSRTPGDKTPFTMVTLADLGLYGSDGKPSVSKREIPGTEPALNHTTIGALAKTADLYDFIIHPGDIGYADDWILDPTNIPTSKMAYSAIIERFYDQLSPISANKPYMVSPGNHEAVCTEVGYFQGRCPVGQYNFSDFTNRFHGMMPTALNKKAQPLANPPFWYSFDAGMVHVVMFDTETDFKNAPDEPGGSQNLGSGPFGSNGQQVNFLNADLASVDRRVTPWVVVAGHRPWYTNGDSSAPCGPCQTAFEDIFYKYGVDVAVFGHIHNLQRFSPIYKNKTDPAGMRNPRAPMYTIIGGPGNIEGHSDITPKTNGNVFAHNADYGFGSLTFHNRTHLEANFFSSVTLKDLDRSFLYKKHDVAFVRQ